METTHANSTCEIACNLLLSKEERFKHSSNITRQFKAQKSRPEGRRLNKPKLYWEKFDLPLSRPDHREVQTRRNGITFREVISGTHQLVIELTGRPLGDRSTSCSPVGLVLGQTSHAEGLTTRTKKRGSRGEVPISSPSTTHPKVGDAMSIPMPPVVLWEFITGGIHPTGPSVPTVAISPHTLPPISALVVALSGHTVYVAGDKIDRSGALRSPWFATA